MKIRLGDLRKIIREVAATGSATRWNPDVPTLDEIRAKSGVYGEAYADLMEFLKTWDVTYEEEGPGGMLPGTLRRKASSRQPFVSTAWDSLMPFEKYCVMSGYARKSDECEAILAPAGAQYGAIPSSNIRFLTSGDAMELANHLMGSSRFDRGSDHARGYYAYENAETHASVAREKVAKAASRRRR